MGVHRSDSLGSTICFQSGTLSMQGQCGQLRIETIPGMRWRAAGAYRSNRRRRQLKLSASVCPAAHKDAGPGASAGAGIDEDIATARR